MTDLVCPVCHRDGFADLRGMRAHERSHQTVVCPECRQEFGALGIGSHRRTVHGVAGAAKANRKEARAVAAQQRTNTTAELRRLYPGLAAGLVSDLAAFVVANQPDGDLFVVAAPGERPRLCKRIMVGEVCSHFAGVPVVLRLARLLEIRSVADDLRVPLTACRTESGGDR